MASWESDLHRFEAELRGSGSSESTIAGYVRDVSAFAHWLKQRRGEQALPGVFSTQDVEAFKEHLRAVGRSPASINRSLQSLRRFGKFMLALGLQKANPAQNVSLVEFEPPSPPRGLSRDEVKRLVQAARSRRSRTADRDQAILQLLLQTGIRVSELVRLRSSDVEFGSQEGQLTVRSCEGIADRQIPLDRAARQALKTYLEGRRRDSDGHLFVGRGDKPLSIRSVQQIVADLGKSADLEVSSKTLRATCAESLWRETGDLGLMAERLGYREPGTVLKFILPISNNSRTRKES